MKDTISDVFLKENLLVLLDSSLLDMDDQISDMLEVFDDYIWVCNTKLKSGYFDLLVMKIINNKASTKEIYQFLTLVDLNYEHHLVARLYQLNILLKN